jgi:quercetin dioxygenase-like cupin family protein
MYKINIVIKFIFLPILLFSTAHAEDRHIDPVTVSANMYKVVLENEHVRVVEYEILPGQKDKWHTHPAKVSHVISGGMLKITTEAGESFFVEEEKDSTSWFEAVAIHYAENTGNTPVKILLVEIKSVAASRIDVNKYRRD